ncbi:MAG: DUF423 domain-containing protein [Cyclobacteriaceae bacterium]|nr:DUF423 domain-containing protein [Cyclobacteriaceae bacterium]MCK5369900.1 DUF423 domain-containing protein [Cyclobacteriaceae bacterium]MCK5699543.1 DUF423 domain-containing protein [Cyclobacteriaceae bacterium]
MQKLFLIIGSILGALSVIIGAFGAHALKKLLESTGRIEVFETAVKYQFYHALALMLLGILMFNIKHQFLNYAGYSFVIGVIIFSGSLYILCLTGITKFGMITPIGGLFMIAGWLFLLVGIIKSI